MKAREITKQTLKFINSGEYRFGLINFPNPDMVGHTGDFQAVVKAIEIVDKCIQQICEIALAKGGIVILTADHGNADEMIEKIDGKTQTSTRHSFNPVPFIIVDKNFSQQYKLLQNSSTTPLGLSSIASTSLLLLGENTPTELDRNLFQ